MSRQVISRNLIHVNIGNHVIHNCTEKKLHGVKTDTQLLFKTHVSTLSKKKLTKSYTLL